MKNNSRVDFIYFPFLKEHSNHEVARKQMKGSSGMVSFRLKGNRASVDRFFSNLRIFALAESLGGVESLACYPFTMTHKAIPDAEKIQIGITETLIRLSVGLEDVEDLLDDLKNALNRS